MEARQSGKEHPGGKYMDPAGRRPHRGQLQGKNEDKRRTGWGARDGGGGGETAWETRRSGKWCRLQNY